MKCLFLRHGQNNKHYIYNTNSSVSLTLDRIELLPEPKRTHAEVTSIACSSDDDIIALCKSTKAHLRLPLKVDYSNDILGFFETKLKQNTPI